MTNKKVWVYDLETLNIFTATFLDRDSDDVKVFVLTNEVNQIKDLLEFLSNKVKGLIGYNCLYFDSQILEYIIRYPDSTAEDIRRYANIIVNSEDRKLDWPEYKLSIPHLDLFKALSLSTSAKRVGLKWCEFMLDLENIEDMPSQGEGDNWTKMVLSYNMNDVIATKRLYQEYIHEIDLRKELTVREKINLLNCTEPDMAKKLFGKYLSKAMGISESILKSLSTKRDVVFVNEIIFDYVKFKTDIFNLTLKEFKKLELKEGESFSYTTKYKDVDIDWGIGGLHASVQNKIIESDKDYIIKSLDFVSWYPNLAIKNGICAEHLPKDIFLKLYEGFFNERRSIPKSDPRNYILKILLNSSYGLSNDKYSFLRDRKVTLSICINGQLLLAMLFEDILESIRDSKLIMVNTDGCEILIPRDKEEEYNTICNKYQDLYGIEIEFVDYTKMIIRDVNNYIAIDTKGKIKCKGAFEFHGMPLGNDKFFKMPLHKNKSYSVIAKAVYNYFVHDIPVEKTIKEDNNIYNFCAGVKAKKADKKGASWFELHSINNNKISKEKLSKTVRYFISTKGKTLFKCYENGDIQHVEAPYRKGKTFKEWKVTYFNKYYEVNNFDEYNIDYTYYIVKAKEWIYEIKNNNLTLF